MPKAVIISDNSGYGWIGNTRYMGAYAIANALEAHGISTVVVDYASMSPNIFNVLASVLTEDTMFIGLSSTFMTTPPRVDATGTGRTWDFASDYLMTPPFNDDPNYFDGWVRNLKNLASKICPKAKIIMGGGKVQSVMNYPLPLFDSIDYFVWGPIDQAIHEIYNDLQSTGEIQTFDYNGRKIADTKDKYKQTKTCPPMKWKEEWNIQYGEALPLEVARGCRFNCKFCHYEKQESFRKNLDDLKAELIRNYETMGTRFYHFADDCFNDHPEKVRSICNLILSLPFKIEWISFARVDVAVKFPDTADLMVESGARGLFWGLESFNETAARNAGKGTPTAQVKKFLKDFYGKHKDVCTSLGSFIVGLPGETIESQKATIDWVINEPALHFISVSPLRISPYKMTFDKNILDYAEYSRNPAKYGFKFVNFNQDQANNKFSEDWSHETMNFTQAQELANFFLDSWAQSAPSRRGLGRSIWTYPHLRSLGYSQKEVFEIYFRADKISHYARDVRHRFQQRTVDYFSSFTHPQFKFKRTAG